MKYLITESQKIKIKTKIESFLNKRLHELKKDIEEDDDFFNLDYEAIKALDKIEVSDYYYDSYVKVMKILVRLYTHTNKIYFEDVLYELQHYLKKFIGDCAIIEEDVINTSKIGPGIDW